MASGHSPDPRWVLNMYEYHLIMWSINSLPDSVTTAVDGQLPYFAPDKKMMIFDWGIKMPKGAFDVEWKEEDE